MQPFSGHRLGDGVDDHNLGACREQLLGCRGDRPPIS
jgi:hypothetical protein